MILVAGGTGRLGTLVVGRLIARGERVRVLTRDISRGAHLLGPLVEVVLGDVRDRSSLTAPMVGVRTVVSAVHGFAGPGRVNPRTVDRDGNANLVAAAKSAGADMVLMSVVGAAQSHPLELFRMKAAAEADLRASGIPWTIIRAPAFLELYLDLMRRSAQKSGRALVFGRGTTEVNFVPVADVADAVAGAVLDNSQRSAIVEVCGPRNLPLTALAQQVQRELGAQNRSPRHVPRPMLRLLAASRRVVNSTIARQAQAALVMDTTEGVVHFAQRDFTAER